MNYGGIGYIDNRDNLFNYSIMNNEGLIISSGRITEEGIKYFEDNLPDITWAKENKEFK